MGEIKKNTEEKQHISESILSFLRLQRSILFKSKILLFIIVVPLFVFLMLISVVPITLAAFVLISINLNVIGYYQFGSFYISFENTTVEKNILLNNSSKIMKDLNFLIFSLILSVITTFFLIGIVWLLQFLVMKLNFSLGYVTSDRSLINWEHIWWNNLVVYITLASLLASSTSYFVIHLTNYNTKYFYSIGVIFLFVVIFFGGTFITEYQIDFNESSNTYEWIGNSRASNGDLFSLLQSIFPNYQLNQIAAYTFRIPDADLTNLNPLFEQRFQWNYVYSFLWVIIHGSLGLTFQLSNKY